MQVREGNSTSRITLAFGQASLLQVFFCLVMARAFHAPRAPRAMRPLPRIDAPDQGLPPPAPTGAARPQRERRGKGQQGRCGAALCCSASPTVALCSRASDIADMSFGAFYPLQ